MPSRDDPQGAAERTRMGFEEAMTRARAAHTKVRVVHQPGNDYRAEVVCRCGAFVFLSDWNAHVLLAADKLIRGLPVDEEER